MTKCYRISHLQVSNITSLLERRTTVDSFRSKTQRIFTIQQDKPGGILNKKWLFVNATGKKWNNCWQGRISGWEWLNKPGLEASEASVIVSKQVEKTFFTQITWTTTASHMFLQLLEHAAPPTLLLLTLIRKLGFYWGKRSRWETAVSCWVNRSNRN